MDLLSTAGTAARSLIRVDVPFSPCFIPGSVSSGQPSFTSRLCRLKPFPSIRAANPDFNPWKPPNETGKKSVGLPGSPSRGRMPNDVDPPALGSFRPPPLPIPGYSMPPPRMRGSSLSPEEEAAKREKDEKMQTLLSLVRDMRGSWLERAEAIQELQLGGYTTETLYEATYVSYDKQMAMVVAAQVYESLAADGTPEDVLAALDESRIGQLYNLRILHSYQRKAAAEYVVANQLDAAGSLELARAVKDHERRPLGREGFTQAPGDCLAFMLHRAAAEAKDRETRDRAMERALSVVVSDSARRRLEDFLAAVA